MTGTNKTTTSYTTCEAGRQHFGAKSMPWLEPSLELPATRMSWQRPAFLQLPTPATPSKYHIYQGTQCSRTIEQEHIPSWWVVLAIVLHEVNSIPDPHQQQPKHQGHAAHKKKTAPKTATSNKAPTNAVVAYVSNPKCRVRKTICKRRSKQRSSQHTTASQRKAAL